MGRKLPAKPRGPHNLVLLERGRNRYKPGTYLCDCGKKFTSIGAFEKHRAAARAELKNNG